MILWALGSELDILKSAEYLIMACEHDCIPDVACGGIRGLYIRFGAQAGPSQSDWVKYCAQCGLRGHWMIHDTDRGHRQVLPETPEKYCAWDTVWTPEGLWGSGSSKGCQRPQEVIQLDILMYVMWTLHWILYDCVRHGHDILDIMHIYMSLAFESWHGGIVLEWEKG